MSHVDGGSLAWPCGMMQRSDVTSCTVFVVEAAADGWRRRHGSRAIRRLMPECLRLQCERRPSLALDQFGGVNGGAGVAAGALGCPSHLPK